ncbi:MAG: hypothetical protein ACOVQ0_06930 [Novosphingobium sp.]|uniref:hypothetical protein n=1 Tax=Novosphingobium sp. TaxID=1874826 RepID=UPI003B99266C
MSALAEKFIIDVAQSNHQCAVCAAPAEPWDDVDGFPFTECPSCGSIAIAAEFMSKVDMGESLRHYDHDYWQNEIRSAKERCWGGSVARAAEAILLCRRPVDAFVDLGCGSGDLLDSLSFYLPASRNKLFGVEMFPPNYHSTHPGFIKSGIAEVDREFDCGVYIEVIEHLTPAMLDSFVAGLAKCALPNSFFIFNTGLAPYVNNEDKGYIDPIRRGHIVSYGWNAIERIYGRHGFAIRRLGNRDWAFGAEYSPDHQMTIGERTWLPLAENGRMLDDPITGSVTAILARESMRAYE